MKCGTGPTVRLKKGVNPPEASGCRKGVDLSHHSLGPVVELTEPFPSIQLSRTQNGCPPLPAAPQFAV
jgi:hypothetical protein